jgi:hypothetical protein
MSLEIHLLAHDKDAWHLELHNIAYAQQSCTSYDVFSITIVQVITCIAIIGQVITCMMVLYKL